MAEHAYSAFFAFAITLGQRGVALEVRCSGRPGERAAAGRIGRPPERRRLVGIGAAARAAGGWSDRDSSGIGPTLRGRDAIR